MRYPREVVDEVRLQNDIVEVISQYVPLKQKGSSYFGLCPFHNEKTASFSVNSEKQFYYCFGCGAAGNVFSFLMEMENCDFPEAMKRLAERAHITLPEPEKNAQAIAAEQLKKRLFEMHTLAGRFFYEALQKEEGAEARAYLQKRQMDPRMARKFGIGYSPDSYDALFKHLQEKGFKISEILKTGLVLENKDGKGYHDRFRGRLMFPIFDVQGRVVGFGGRILAKGEPKYLNSPETILFSKSRNLYGLNFAKQTRKRELILVEGYMDMLSIYQAGFHNVVASLGTAFNQEHARTLKRFADDVILLYDSDEAGVKAALRAIPMLKGVGLTTRVVNLRPYKDPDEFIQHEGCEAFEKRLEEAENSVLYEIRMKERDFDLADPQGKSDFLHEAVRRLVAIEDEIERNSYLEAVAGKYGIAVEVLRKQVGQMALSGAGRTERVKPRNTAANKKEKEGGVEKAQKLMLTWMTSYPALIGKLEKYITPEDFTTPLYRQIAEMIVLQYHEGGVNPAKLLNQFVDSEEQKEVAGLFNARIPLETEEEKRRALHDVICNMKENSIAYQSAHMNVTDMAALQKLMADKKSLERWKAGELPDFAF